MRDRTISRCLKLALPGAMISAALATSVWAVQSPPGCNANTLNLTLSRSTGVAVPGQSVDFGVTVSVPATDGSGVPACDTSNVTITAQCPDADNNVPPTTPVQILQTGQNYLAGTAPTPVGSITCTMPEVPVNKAISAYSAASGLLLDTDLLAGSDFTRANTITVTVTPCQVKVDKQVSCDNGSTWVDPSLVLNNEDGTLDCAVVGLNNPVQVRYQASNTSQSCLLTDCVLTESNANFGLPPLVGILTPGQTTDFLPAVNMPNCDTAYGDPQNPNEPNTVTITCQTGGDPVTASDLASFTCLDVDLTVNREVNCGGGFNDTEMVRANDDGTNGCTAIDGAPVNWQYDACNAGLANLFDCTLVDQNTTVSAPIVVGNLAGGECSNDLPATNSPIPCGDAIEGLEVPDNGRVTLTCCTKDVADITACGEGDRVSVYDISTLTCTTPAGLNARKECVDTNQDGTDDNVRVVAIATSGDVGFTDCTATDTIYLADSTCPPSGTGTPIPLTPEGGVTSPFALAPGAEQWSFGTIDPPLTQDACNTATVSCTSVATGQVVEAIAPPVVCNFQGEGCLTRTPGFWGTHPAVTARYLDVQVCGTTIDNVMSDNSTSAIEAICSTGTDMKIQGQQETQLIRQCTAAALNIAATLAEEGDCASGSNIATVFDKCCDAASVCTGVDDPDYSIGDCIYLVDEFNNSEDTFYPDSFRKPGKAQPATCRQSKNNGVVVYPTPAP